MRGVRVTAGVNVKFRPARREKRREKSKSDCRLTLTIHGGKALLTL